MHRSGLSLSADMIHCHIVRRIITYSFLFQFSLLYYIYQFVKEVWFSSSTSFFVAFFSIPLDNTPLLSYQWPIHLLSHYYHITRWIELLSDHHLLINGDNLMYPYTTTFPLLLPSHTRKDLRRKPKKTKRNKEQQRKR